MFLLLYLFLFTAGGAATVFDQEQSPPPSQMRAAGPLVEMTPGQVVSVEQARIQPELFLSVFSREVVDSWDIHWDVFQDMDLVFDAPRKRAVIKTIEEKFKYFSGTKNIDYYTLSGQIADIRRQMEAVHEDRLAQIARGYFCRLFPQSHIETLSKTGGVQLGKRVVVRIDQKQYTYYVKTHSQGRLEEKSSPPEIIKPEELLVYKFLELSGFGPACHFFERSPQDVYLATLDAAVVNGKQGQFLTLNRCEGAQLDRLTGGLSRQLAQETAEMEAILEHNPEAQVFARNLMLTDILARVFRLTDVSENYENFGFTFLDGQMPLLRVIDFRVRNDRNFAIVKDHFLGFLEGNGEFNYVAHQQPFFSYILNRRARQLRFVTGLAVMKGLYAKKSSVELAMSAVRAYIVNPGNSFGAAQESLVTKLAAYGLAVDQNFDLLMRCFSEYESNSEEQRRAA